MFPTLEELARSGEIDIVEHGAKTWGNVELIRARPFARRELGVEYDVPAGFSVPSSSSGEQLGRSYEFLMSGVRELAAVVVRSSHEDEQPGQQKTKWMLYDPSDHTGNLRRFEDAFSEVRNGTNMPVLVQKVPESSADSDLIGKLHTGVAARSHSHNDPSVGVIAACKGLNMKLVDDPDEVCIIKYSDNGFGSPISTGLDYLGCGDSGTYRQEMMYVFDTSSGKITTVPAPHDSRRAFPFGIQRKKWGIQKLTSYFSEKLNCPVELEGSIIDGDDLHFFQLTKSHFLEYALESVSHVPDDRLVYRDEGATVGSLNFSGNVLLYTQKTDAVRRAVRSYRSKDNLLIVSPEFPDEFVDEGATNYVVMRSSRGIREDLGRTVGDIWGSSVAHELGWLNVQLYRRQQQGIACCAFRGDLDLNAVSRPRQYRRQAFPFSDFVHLRGARTEVAKGEMQIYFE